MLFRFGAKIPLFSAVIVAGMLAGCESSDVYFNSLSVRHPTEVSQKEFDKMECDESLDGKFVYVLESDELYECSDAEWVERFASPSDEESSSSKKNVSSSSKGDAGTSSSKKSSSSGTPKSSSSEGSSDSEASASSSSQNGDAGTSSSAKSSSSSSEESSSSSAKSSSSSSSEKVFPSPKVPPCRNAEIDTCKYEYIHDERDGQIYKAVTIGEQTWMTQNLNYDTGDTARQHCYLRLEDYCKRSGKLYSWSNALDYSSDKTLYNTNTSSEKGICPNGWHIPSIDEWQILLANVGYDTTYLRNKFFMETIKTYLFSDTSYITQVRSGESDFYGLSIVGTSYLSYGGFSDYSRAYFWSSTQKNEEEAYVIDIYSETEIHYHKKDFQRAVRCIKDVPKEDGDE